MFWRCGGEIRARAPRRLPPEASGQEQTQPYRLWWYIMLLVFAAAIAESLLADRYLGAQQQEDL